MRTYQGQGSIRGIVREEIVLLAQRAEILPTQSKIQSEGTRYAVIVLGEEAEPVVVRGALGVSGIDGNEAAAESGILRSPGIEVRQSVDDGVRAQSNACRELINAALQVVVEIIDICPAKLSAKLERVLTSLPGEVIEELVSLAGAPTRDAKARGAEVFDSREIELWQPKLASAQVEPVRHGIPGCGERIERFAVAAVAEANLVDIRRGKS